MRIQGIRKFMIPWATFLRNCLSLMSQSFTRASRNLCSTPCSMALILPTRDLSTRVRKIAHSSTTSRRLLRSWDSSTCISIWLTRRLIPKKYRVKQSKSTELCLMPWGTRNTSTRAWILLSSRLRVHKNQMSKKKQPWHTSNYMRIRNSKSSQRSWSLKKQ